MTRPTLLSTIATLILHRHATTSPAGWLVTYRAWGWWLAFGGEGEG